MKIQAEIWRRPWIKLCEALPLAFVVLIAPIWVAGQSNVETIIQKSVKANNRDWDADPQFDYTERDQDKDGIKTYEVTMLFGSPYRRLVRVNDRPLSPSKQAEEQKKFEEALAERRNETPEKRAARISKFQAERKRDHTMLEQLTKAFDFRLLGNQRLKGHSVYVLSAHPRKDYRPPDRDSQVLPGMEGKLWIERNSFQWVRVEAHVMQPVRIEGILAEVEPGTQFELEKMPVTADIWLSQHFAQRSNAKVMLFWPHRAQEDITYSNYHKSSGPAQ